MGASDCADTGALRTPRRLRCLDAALRWLPPALLCCTGVLRCFPRQPSVLCTLLADTICFGQVVAGTNYLFKVQVAPQQFVDVKAFQPLPHTKQAVEVKSVSSSFAPGPVPHE